VTQARQVQILESLGKHKQVVAFAGLDHDKPDPDPRVEKV
jgi:hypothetical protein